MSVGVVGTGYWGKNILRNLAALEALGGFCDVGSEARARSSANHPDIPAFADPEALLATAGIDAVAIATPAATHGALVRQALDAGKHVFVEKPLCRTADELRALRAAWEKAGKPHIRSNLVLREAPVYRWLKQAIDDGSLGRVYAFDGDYLYGRLAKITEGWRKDVPDYSVMEGGGVHLIDLMLWLTGERPARVATVGNRIATEGTDFRYDDFMAATFTFPSGVVGRITANFACVHRHQHVVRVFGTEATFILDDAGPRLHRTRDEGSVAEPLEQEPLPAGKGVLIPDFVAGILDGRDPASAAAREFDLISATAAADEALAEGAAVEIGYVT